jgi:hypothetical protein
MADPRFRRAALAAQLFSGGFNCFCLAARDNDRRPAPAQPACHGQADAAARAGYQGPPAEKIEWIAHVLSSQRNSKVPIAAPG